MDCGGGEVRGEAKRGECRKGKLCWCLKETCGVARSSRSRYEYPDSHSCSSSSLTSSLIVVVVRRPSVIERHSESGVGEWTLEAARRGALISPEQKRGRRPGGWVVEA